MTESVENNAETTLIGGCTGKGFMPGQSGNPGGRPKNKPVTELYKGIVDDPEAMAGLRMAIVELLKSGEMPMVQMIKEITDRVEGKVTQQISGPDGGAIELSLAAAISAACKRAGITDEE